VNTQPRLSVVVIVYRMTRQAMNTLFSLSARYQTGVEESDYEVIVVENESDSVCDPTAVAALGNNFHYFRREESGVSPVPALAFALEQARGELLGIMVDGARMLTPRVLEYALMADAMVDDAVVTVPAYHLGESDQKDNLSSGHDEQAEIAKLAELDWQANGYRLFQFACFSSGTKAGYMQPMLESSALFCRRQSYLEMGGAPAGFDQPGGGSVNLYLYRKLLLRESTRFFVLAGEGSFHQFHGGVTTRELEEREAMLLAFDQRLEELYAGPFKSSAREPQLLGAVTHFAQAFLAQSLDRSLRRFSIHAKQGQGFWDDESFGYWTEQLPSEIKALREAKPVQWEVGDD
jgi:hypothetical protein